MSVRPCCCKSNDCRKLRMIFASNTLWNHYQRIKKRMKTFQESRLSCLVPISSSKCLMCLFNRLTSSLRNIWLDFQITCFYRKCADFGEPWTTNRTYEFFCWNVLRLNWSQVCAKKSHLNQLKQQFFQSLESVTKWNGDQLQQTNDIPKQFIFDAFHSSFQS